MNIETPKTTVEKSAESIFNSLSNIENFEKLMPSSLQKFEIVNPETFKFSLKGMLEIELKVKERVPNAMMAMMIKGPITKFMESISSSMDKL